MQVHLLEVIFCLKIKKIIIKVKHTRKELTNKKLKDELIIDKEQYKQNKKCETFYCFLYDSEKRIKNPTVNSYICDP